MPGPALSILCRGIAANPEVAPADASFSACTAPANTARHRTALHPQHCAAQHRTPGTAPRYTPSIAPPSTAPPGTAPHRTGQHHTAPQPVALLTPPSLWWPARPRRHPSAVCLPHGSANPYKAPTVPSIPTSPHRSPNPCKAPTGSINPCKAPTHIENHSGQKASSITGENRKTDGVADRYYPQRFSMHLAPLLKLQKCLRRTGAHAEPAPTTNQCPRRTETSLSGRTAASV